MEKGWGLGCWLFVKEVRRLHGLAGGRQRAGSSEWCVWVEVGRRSSPVLVVLVAVRFAAACCS